jgi:hypothetical protein
MAGCSSLEAAPVCSLLSTSKGNLKKLYSAPPCGVNFGWSAHQIHRHGADIVRLYFRRPPFYYLLSQHLMEAIGLAASIISLLELGKKLRDVALTLVGKVCPFGSSTLSSFLAF